MRTLELVAIGWITLSMALGCSPAQPRDATTFSASSQRSAATAGDRDQQAIEAVLADLMTLKDSPVETTKSSPPMIRFAMEPSTYPVSVDGITMRHEKEKWEALSKAELNAATEAASDVVRRHAAKEAFKPFQPTDARVKVQAVQQRATTMGSIYERPVQAWPPGFTSDGQYAVVFLSIPWSMHHADATYLLAREGDGWRIVLRQFVYYV